MIVSNKILLIDSNSLLHRAYHALPNLKSSKGDYTGAIFGFLNLLLRIIKEQQPTHIAAAFDVHGPTFRHEMFDRYKATRKPMDSELACQVQPLKDLLALMNIKVVEAEGYEADDILGTLSKRFDDDTIVLTGDRDSFQLVGDTTSVYWTKKGVSEIEIITPEVLKDMGFTVSSFIDFKALRGDPSDNIPGVSGVGEVTAKNLLDTYGTLEKVLDHADEVKGKLGETLLKSRDIALLSRELATIDRDAPIPCNLKELEFNPVYNADVKSKLAEYELTSLISRMKFTDDNAATTEKKDYKKKVVELTDLQSIEKAIVGDKISLLIGTDIKFSTDGKTEYAVVCGDDLFAALTFESALKCVIDNLNGKQLICYDYKSMSKTYGFEAKDFFDVMIAAHLVRGSAPIKSLEAVLGAEGLQSGAAEIFAYAIELKTELKEKNLEDLFYKVEQPLAVVLKNMEERGFGVDKSQLDKLQVKYSTIVEDLTEKIYDAAGTKFNVASPKQLGEVLFDKLGLKHGKKTKTGYSVGEDVLTSLSDEHPVVPLILEWRHFNKLLSTYVSGLQPLVVRGRIHTEFNQCITTTGRLSSTNPNLQNIPVRGDEAKDVKSAFVPSQGNVLISADYSQIELRLLAHFSNDEKLIDAYRNSNDIHALTASQILNKPIDKVTSAERRDAKAVNFGIIYGMSDFGLAENLSIPKYKAKEFIERYFASYPTVKSYLEGRVKEAREKGYAVTLLGRRRDLSDLNASNYIVRSGAERMAKNTPLQGSAADVIKLAMLGVEKRLKNMKSKMILQVHDELIIDAVISEREEVKRILKEEMEGAVELKVPLIADVNEGDNWGDVK